MLILIFVDVQYLQNVVLSLEKGSNGQNHSLSESQHSVKISPEPNFLPHSLDLFEKSLHCVPFVDSEPKFKSNLIKVQMYRLR